jgi:hypothetical protein
VKKTQNILNHDRKPFCPTGLNSFPDEHLVQDGNYNSPDLVLTFTICCPPLPEHERGISGIQILAEARETLYKDEATLKRIQDPQPHKNLEVNQRYGHQQIFC